MSNSTILLVEREAKTRRLLRVALEQAGYDLVVARDGADALNKLEAERPDLVIAATHLPKLDGYGLVKRMKEHAHWRSIPVVFMVAGGSIEDKIRGLELGVEDYLSKPVFVKELLSRVEVLLAKKVRQHLSESVTQTRVQGSLGDLPTIDILESLEQGQQSGVVRIRFGDREGEVIFEEGEIIDARLKKLRGEEVVYRLLCWTEGTFEVELKNVEAEAVIEVGTRALIEAGMRHAAEYHRLLAGLPSTDVAIEIDREALVARLGEVPADLERILELLDGRRTVLDVIDESPFDDISTLQTVSQLASEGLLHEVLQDHPSIAPDIPRPPRTPAPPTSDVAPAPAAEEMLEQLEAEEAQRAAVPPAPAVPVVAALPAPAEQDDDEDHEGDDDMAPTLRPPDGRRRSKRRAEPIAVAGVPEDARPTIQIPPTDQDAIGRLSQPRADVGAAELQSAASEAADSSIEAPITAVGHRGPEEESAPAADPPAVERPGQPLVERAEEQSPPEPEGRRAPKSIPPDTASVDEAFGTDPAPTPSDPGASAQAATADSSVEPPAPDDAHDLAGSEVPRPPTSSDAAASGAGSSSPPPASSEPGSVRSDRRRPPRRTRPRRAVDGEDSGPVSGPTPLSTSGVAEQFFASLSPEHGPDSELPVSEREPEFLTEEQVARKRRGIRVVAIVVGVLCALVLFVSVRGRLGRQGPTAATGSASTAPSSRPAPSSGGATTVATTAPTPSSTASAAATGGGGGAGGQGGAAAGGAGGAAADAGAAEGGGEAGELPDVEDPLAEAKKLLNSGRYRDTIPMAQAAIKKDPADGDAYFYLGMAYQSIGEIEKSKDAFDACVANATKGANMSWCRTYARRK